MTEYAYREGKNNEAKIKTERILEQLPDYCTDYIQSIERSKAPLTRLSYIQKIKIFFDYLHDKKAPFKDKDIIDITPADLDTLTLSDAERFVHNIYTHQADKPERENSNKTVELYISAMNSFFKYLIVKRQVNSNPFFGIERNKPAKRLPEYLDPDEQEKLIDSATDGLGLTKPMRDYRKKNGTSLRDLLILKMLLGTGIRVSELVGLDLEHIELEKCRMHVLRKENKEDIVFFDDEVKELLKEYIEEDRKRYSPAKDEKALFLVSIGKYKGQRLSVRSVELLVRKYGIASGQLKGPDLHPHSLRHTYAESLYKATRDIALVKEALAHENIQTTLIYAQADMKDKENVRNLLLHNREEQDKK